MDVPKGGTADRDIQRGESMWTQHEDSTLQDLVNTYGRRLWSILSDLLAAKCQTLKRTGNQLRERFVHHLGPKVKRSRWTEEDKYKFEQAHRKLGNKWVEIAKLIPDKTDAQVRNFWYSNKRKEARRAAREKLASVGAFDKKKRAQSLSQDDNSAVHGGSNLQQEGAGSAVTEELDLIGTKRPCPRSTLVFVHEYAPLPSELQPIEDPDNPLDIPVLRDTLGGVFDEFVKTLGTDIDTRIFPEGKESATGDLSHCFGVTNFTLQNGQDNRMTSGIDTNGIGQGGNHVLHGSTSIRVSPIDTIDSVHVSSSHVPSSTIYRSVTSTTQTNAPMRRVCSPAVAAQDVQNDESSDVSAAGGSRGKGSKDKASGIFTTVPSNHEGESDASRPTQRRTKRARLLPPARKYKYILPAVNAAFPTNNGLFPSSTAGHSLFGPQLQGGWSPSTQGIGITPPNRGSIQLPTAGQHGSIGGVDQHDDTRFVSAAPAPVPLVNQPLEHLPPASVIPYHVSSPCRVSREAPVTTPSNYRGLVLNSIDQAAANRSQHQQILGQAGQSPCLAPFVSSPAVQSSYKITNARVRELMYGRNMNSTQAQLHTGEGGSTRLLSSSTSTRPLRDVGRSP